MSENEVANPPTFEKVSMWVSFRVNPRPRVFEGGVKIGTKEIGGEVVRTSRYIGTFCSGKFGFVFPYSYLVEQEIEKREKLNPDGPWILPVFVKESRNAFQAYAIDDVTLAQERGELIGRDVFQTLEARVYIISKLLLRIQSGISAERIMIVIDFPYLYKSIQEEKITSSDIDDIIELICKWGVPIRRDETILGEKRVYIIDFYNPEFVDLYETWKNRGYKFIPVYPDESGVNPTDKVIIDTSLAEIDRIKEEVDAFCLVSGDRHFHDVVRDIRQMGKKVMIASFHRNTAKEMYIIADYYCDLSFCLHTSKNALTPKR